MAGRGVDFELVHQPLCAGKTDAQTFTRGASIPESLIDVRDARPFIMSNDFHPAPAKVRLYGGKTHFAALGVIDHIARDFADGGGDHGDVAPCKAEPDRVLTPFLPCR